MGPINIVTFYRPPSANIHEFFLVLQQFLNNIPYNHQPLLICADVNIDMHKASPASNEFKTLLRDYGLHIYGNEASRVTFTSATQIDIVICNSFVLPYLCAYNSINTGISDHNVIMFGYKKPKPSKPPCKIISQIKLNIPNLDCIKVDLQEITSMWPPLNHGDTDHSLGIFMSTINHLKKKHGKLRLRKSRGN